MPKHWRTLVIACTLALVFASAFVVRPQVAHASGDNGTAGYACSTSSTDSWDGSIPAIYFHSSTSCSTFGGDFITYLEDDDSIWQCYGSGPNHNCNGVWTNRYHGWNCYSYDTQYQYSSPNCTNGDWAYFGPTDHGYWYRAEAYSCVQSTHFPNIHCGSYSTNAQAFYYA